MPTRIQDDEAAPLQSHNEKAVWQHFSGPNRPILENGICLGWERLDRAAVDFKNAAILSEQQNLSRDRFQDLLDLRPVQKASIDGWDEMIVNDFIQGLSASVSENFVGTGKEKPRKSSGRWPCDWRDDAIAYHQ